MVPAYADHVAVAVRDDQDRAVVVAPAADRGFERLLGSFLGDVEIEEHRQPLVGEQDVGRLHVAVQDAALVGVVDRPGNRYQELAGPALLS